MSLTYILKNDGLIIKLFNCIPNLRLYFKTIGNHKEAFPKYLKPVVHKVKNADPAIVGAAYDFWLRAYIQRINHIHKEVQLSPIIRYGLNLLQEDRV